MKTISFAAIILAGAAAFSGVARADETVTAVNQESARIAHPSAPTIWGAPVAESRQLSAPHQTATVSSSPARASRRLGVPHQPAGIGPEIAYGDRSFIGQGDRGIGNN